MLVAIDCTWVQRSGKGGFGADPDFLCWIQWFCWQISTSVIFVAWERFRLSGDADFWGFWRTNPHPPITSLLLLNPLSSNSRVYSWDRIFPIRFHISNSLPLSSTSFKACFSVLMGVSGSEAWRNSKGVLTDNLDDPELTQVSIVDPLSAGPCELMVSSVGEIESDSANSESWTSSAWEASSRSTLRSPAICGAPVKKDCPSVSVSTSASKAARRDESRGGQNSFYN